MPYEEFDMDDDFMADALADVEKLAAKPYNEQEARQETQRLESQQLGERRPLPPKPSPERPPQRRSSTKGLSIFDEAAGLTSSAAGPARDEPRPRFPAGNGPIRGRKLIELPPKEPDFEPSSESEIEDDEDDVRKPQSATARLLAMRKKATSAPAASKGQSATEQLLARRAAVSVDDDSPSDTSARPAKQQSALQRLSMKDTNKKQTVQPRSQKRKAAPAAQRAANDPKRQTKLCEFEHVAPSLDSMLTEMEFKRAEDNAVIKKTEDRVKQRWDREFGHCFPDLMEGVSDELQKARASASDDEVDDDSNLSPSADVEASPSLAIGSPVVDVDTDDGLYD